MQFFLNIAIAMLTALMLLSCQSFSPQPITARPAQTAVANLASDYRQLAAVGGVVYGMDPAASDVRIYVFRGGVAARLGHNHILSAVEFEGYVHLPSQVPTQAGFDLRVPLDALVIDDPRLRAETGDAFAGERPAADIEGTRRNMLGPRGLDTAQFPFMTFKSVEIAGDWPVLVVDVDITLHDVTHRQSVILNVLHDQHEMTVKGRFILRQSDFGITPYTLFGGLMTVQDTVAIEFKLKANPL